MKTTSKVCCSCQRILTRDEVGLSQKLLDDGDDVLFCLDCLSEDLCCSVEDLECKIEEFKEQGCSKFL